MTDEYVQIGWAGPTYIDSDELGEALPDECDNCYEDKATHFPAVPAADASCPHFEPTPREEAGEGYVEVVDENGTRWSADPHEWFIRHEDGKEDLINPWPVYAKKSDLP